MPRRKQEEDFDAGPDELGADEQAAIERLGSLDMKDILKLAHKKTMVLLLAKLETGSISHQELGILRNMLKDNGQVLGVPPDAQLARQIPPADLPDFEPPDYAN